MPHTPRPTQVTIGQDDRGLRLDLFLTQIQGHTLHHRAATTRRFRGLHDVIKLILPVVLGGAHLGVPIQQTHGLRLNSFSYSHHLTQERSQLTPTDGTRCVDSDDKLSDSLTDPAW